MRRAAGPPTTRQTRTIAAALVDVRLHLEVQVAGANVDGRGQHLLDVGLAEGGEGGGGGTTTHITLRPKSRPQQATAWACATGGHAHACILQLWPRSRARTHRCSSTAGQVVVAMAEAGVRPNVWWSKSRGRLAYSAKAGRPLWGCAHFWPGDVTRTRLLAHLSIAPRAVCGPSRAMSGGRPLSMAVARAAHSYLMNEQTQ